MMPPPAVVERLLARRDRLTARAIVSLGAALLMAGRFDEAIDLLEALLDDVNTGRKQAYDDFANAYFNLGIAYSALERHEDAIVAQRQALRLFERSEDDDGVLLAAVNAAGALLAHQRYDQVLQLLQPRLTMWESGQNLPADISELPLAYAFAAQAAYKLRNLELARSLFLSASSIAPAGTTYLAQLHNNISAVLLLLGTSLDPPDLPTHALLRVFSRVAFSFSSHSLAAGLRRGQTGMMRLWNMPAWPGICCQRMRWRVTPWIVPTLPATSPPVWFVSSRLLVMRNICFSQPARPRISSPPSCAYQLPNAPPHLPNQANLSQFEEALQHLHVAWESLSTLNRPLHAARCLEDMGAVRFHLGDLHGSLRLYQEVLGMALRLDDAELRERVEQATFMAWNALQTHDQLRHRLRSHGAANEGDFGPTRPDGLAVGETPRPDIRHGPPSASYADAAVQLPPRPHTSQLVRSGTKPLSPPLTSTRPVSMSVAYEELFQKVTTPNSSRPATAAHDPDHDRDNHLRPTSLPESTDMPLSPVRADPQRSSGTVGFVSPLPDSEGPARNASQRRRPPPTPMPRLPIHLDDSLSDDRTAAHPHIPDRLIVEPRTSHGPPQRSRACAVM
ncbi:uncharacterized protein MONBRDRAFT_10861 [Monosiga brevicollis MX1]|uniref:Uncharacterized protein n=1 Tax=Monosiga brevicollis TaxID=81824 RepID=A9V7G2_MONBE|nr:uncharacterized protein MONBRDRAFT_10861 [Monosiga brevicollis MX1]EDQ86581.1 predicted protein [Monosiga brevicollis MX1]|eukprot:XP_001748694.1 hypothetical protein [Monosiga brevicollis MX1]